MVRDTRKAAGTKYYEGGVNRGNRVPPAKPQTQLDKARAWKEEHGSLSVDFLMRKLRINGAAAQRLMDQL